MCAHTRAHTHTYIAHLILGGFGNFPFSSALTSPNRQPQLWICPFGWKKNGSSWKLNCSGDVREKPVFSPETAAKSTVVETQARTSCLSLLSGKIPFPSPKSWLHGNKNNCNRPVFCCFLFAGSHCDAGWFIRFRIFYSLAFCPFFFDFISLASFVLAVRREKWELLSASFLFLSQLTKSDIFFSLPPTSVVHRDLKIHSLYKWINKLQ